MAIRKKHSVVLRLILLGLLCLCWGSISWAQSVAPTASALGQYGAVRGWVKDLRGIAQAGIPVTITRQDGLFIRKVLTTRTGRYDLARLVPGLYAIEVTLPNFLPFSKAPVSIKSGADVQIDISLRTLAETIEVGLPPDAAQSRDEWRWALRTASPARPVLRFLKEVGQTARGDAGSPVDHPLRGTVFVSAGNEASSFGADPGVRTVFDVGYDWTSRTALDVAGSAGFERATPAASMRASWSHRSESDSLSSLSFTVRQLFLPSAYRQTFSASGINLGSRFQSFSGKYENESALTEHVTLRYGAVFENISLMSNVSHWSPYGRLTYTPTPGGPTRWMLSYSAESPTQSPAGPAGLSETKELQPFPQISGNPAGSHRTALETGSHVEAAWQRTLSERFRVEGAAFYDALSDVAISIASTDDFLMNGLLQDPFSSTHFLDGGGYRSAGARGTLEARLTPHSELIVGYSFAGGIRAVETALLSQDSSALREMLRSRPGSSWVVKVRSTLPGSHTEVVTSYRWLPRNSVVPGDQYDSGAGRSEPYLNVALVQPIPSPEVLQGQFQAIADFSNLLAQGYLPIRNSDGATSYFFPSARSFRGGFSFVF